MAYSRSKIRRLLGGVDGRSLNVRAVARGIVRLYSFQAIDEQRDERTRWKNRRGFSVATVKRGTELARKLLKRQRITLAEMQEAADICRLHAGQLADFANGQRADEGCWTAFGSNY